MQTFLLLRNEQIAPLPPEVPGPDMRFPAAFVEHFLHELSHEGDVVFDPFAGFGGTLTVAEALGRQAYGVEYTQARTDYARSLMRHPDRLIDGDSRQLTSYDLPLFDLSITSPPYMGKTDLENPFTNYMEDGGGYSQYLDDIATIYRQVRNLMKPEARAIIEVSNLKHKSDPPTALAWDIAKSVSRVLTFEGEVVICWENGYGYGYDHSYALIFRRPP